MKIEENKYTKIKVIGVGGGGNSAVNRMISSGMDKNVEFWAVNTDLQALEGSLAENILPIGKASTSRLGAGSNPAVGAKAAEESIEEITKMISGSDMLFITAGMGGGTGTGASPVIARIAKQAGVLTVGVVTKPFRFEGQVRIRQAEEGITTLRQEVDALIVIPNDKLLQVIEQTTSIKDAFRLADGILQQGVHAITDIISNLGLLQLDFADVQTIMQDKGSAIMGIGRSSGSQRAIEAAEAAISNPLLEESITGATGVILNISSGENLSLYEVNEAASIIHEAVDPNAHIIFGLMIKENLKDDVEVTVIATGFKPNPNKVAEPVIPEIRSRFERTFEKDTKPVKENVKPILREAETIVEPEPVKKIDSFADAQQEDDFDDDINIIPTFLRKRK